jgi:hypothetical protein
MNKQPSNANSASPFDDGARIEVRGSVDYSQQHNRHPTLSLEKGEATDQATGMRSSRDYDY